MNNMNINDAEIRKALNNSIWSTIEKIEPIKQDMTNLQQKAYDECIKHFNTLEVGACIKAIEYVDDLVDSLKPKHFQIGDTIYYYNRCKNQIEAYVVESVAIKDKHIIYNYIYDSEAVKGSYDEILRYAIEAIENDAHNKIDALKMIRSEDNAKKNK